MTITVYAPPEAPDVLARTGVELSVTVSPLASATRSLSSPLVQVTAVEDSADGVVVLNNDGAVTFTPAAGFVGTTSFG